MIGGRVDAGCREAQVRVKIRGSEGNRWMLLKYFRVEEGIHGQDSGDQSTGGNTTDPRDKIK